MSFNSDPTKQAQEVILSQTSKAISDLSLVFNNNNNNNNNNSNNNNNNVMEAKFQKYLGIIPDTQLYFEKHLDTVLCIYKRFYGSYL